MVASRKCEPGKTFLRTASIFPAGYTFAERVAAYEQVPTEKARLASASCSRGDRRHRRRRGRLFPEIYIPSVKRKLLFDSDLRL
jgi:hypothetical protein